MQKHRDANLTEFAKDRAARLQAQRSRAAARCIEEARAGQLTTRLACAHDGAARRIELRSAVGRSE